MKRRDLLKTGLLGAAGVALLSGCSKDEEATASKELEIIPKQTDTYKFSVPLPFNYEVIDKISSFNEKFKKSQVKTFYNSMPLPLSKNFNRWVQIDRGENPNVKTREDFAKFVKYAQDKGYHFCYLMNSPKALSEKDYKALEKEFYSLLDFLYDIGVSEIKVANTQVATFINNYNKPFKLSSSTAAEYHNVSQYKHLINNYPNIELIDIAIDENQNFKYLNNLRKSFPDKTIELMVNEFCLKGCPARISHASELLFKQFDCHRIAREVGTMYAFLKTSAIYPWNLEYYSALGINNFKFMPNGSYGLRANYTNLEPLEMYLSMVEYGVDNYSAEDFFGKIYLRQTNLPKDMKLTSVIPYLPDMKKFIKDGDKCATRCGLDCTYCHDCAVKLEQLTMVS